MEFSTVVQVRSILLKKCDDNGELGFFPVPDTEEMDNMETNVLVHHAGFGIGFNKATYDDTMQEFFDYACEHYSDACYNQGNIFSPFNEELPGRTSTAFL